MRKVFLDELPRYRGNFIYWVKSIGYKIKFIYDDIKGEFEIINYNKTYNTLTIKYKNYNEFRIPTRNLIRGHLGDILKEEIFIPNYDETNPRRIDLRNLPLCGKGIDWKKVSELRIKIPFVYDDIIGELEIIKSVGKYLYIIYNNKNYKINKSVMLYCNLGRILNKKTKDFKIAIGAEFKDDKRDLIILDREYRPFMQNNWKVDLKYYKYHCNKCNYEGWSIETSLKKTGCSVCCNTPQVIVKGINDIPTTAPWMVKYFQGGHEEAKLYTKSSSKKINPICPDCGRIKEKEISINRIYMNHSIGCTCGDGVSYPNKFMFNLLEQLNVSFEAEYNPDWIKPMRYDFYFELNNNKYIIEMDGAWHKIDNNMSGKTKDEVKTEDEYKELKAYENGISVIRIDCEESDMYFIKDKILHSKLNDLFNLNVIDWLKIESFALSNRVKEACDLKKSNPKLTTTDISKIMKLNPTTIRKYLKKGHTLSWCYYNAKEELTKSLSNLKNIEVFKNEISLGVYSDGDFISDNSEKIFGVKLMKYKIFNVANGKQSHYKGYIFKYIKE